METVYLAGPIQHAQDYGKGWRAVIKNEYPHYDWVDPTVLEDPTECDSVVPGANTDLVEEEIKLICDYIDTMLVHWEEVPTVGTPMEIIYANANDVPVIVQTTVADDRLSEWLTYHADVVVETFDAAVEEIEAI